MTEPLVSSQPTVPLSNLVDALSTALKLTTEEVEERLYGLARAGLRVPDDATAEDAVNAVLSVLLSDLFVLEAERFWRFPDMPACFVQRTVSHGSSSEIAKKRPYRPDHPLMESLGAALQHLIAEPHGIEFAESYVQADRTAEVVEISLTRSEGSRLVRDLIVYHDEESPGRLCESHRRTPEGLRGVEVRATATIQVFRDLNRIFWPLREVA
jgi:hypothetical protein